MSRCFPFPPPGYEKKARIEDTDLLKKEKGREKKLKKEKKDKEKRGSKEKKHKDRSEEKRKEKKEKKDKNREKKDEDKTRTSDEQRLLGKTENHNGGHKEHKVNDSTFYEKMYTGQSAGYTGAKLIQDNHLAEEPKIVLDAVKIIKGKDVEKISAIQSKRDDRMVRLVATGSATSMEVAEKIKDHKIDGGRFSTSAMVQNPVATFRTGVEPLEKKESRSLEKKTEGRKETKEKIKEGEGNEKHKDKDREKKAKTKDKEREKEKRKEDKVKEKLEDRRGERNASKESNKETFVGGHSLKTSQLEDSGMSAPPEGNFKKRKDLETNGFLHVDDIRPMKFQKLSSSSHPKSGNGKILEPCQTSIRPPSEGQGTPDNRKLDSKERKINGVIEAAHPSASFDNPTATRQVDQMAAPPPKPAHPDCRYLSQIYSVPKVEEWSDLCDQQWLFNNSKSQERRPKSSEVDKMPQVWAEAFYIESADICALPYVIPY